MKKLILPTIQNFLTGVVIFGLLLFLPAWTLAYWQGWVFILIFMTSASGIGLYLSIKDPVLLERRMKGGPTAESSPVQKVVISLALLSWVGVLIYSGFAFRLGWAQVPVWAALLGDVMVIAGFYIDFLTFQQNSFGGTSIEVVQDQKVISTGLYGIVRHPMYVGVIVMMFGVPLALGSWWGLLLMLLVVPVLVARILDEEKMLDKDLSGYAEYTHQVRYRLVPGLW